MDSKLLISFPPGVQKETSQPNQEEKAGHSEFNPKKGIDVVGQPPISKVGGRDGKVSEWKEIFVGNDDLQTLVP